MRVDSPVALVLIADGEAAIRATLRKQVETAGMRVLVAEDGYRAFSLSLANKPDIIVTGLALGGIDGHALIQKVRGVPKTSRIPIVVLSESAGDPLAILSSGATVVIDRPWNESELRTKMWELIWQARGRNESVRAHYYSCFISYCESDSRFVDRLHRELGLAMVDCWRWKDDARVGQGLWNEIDGAIRDRSRVLLVASREAFNSPAVNREIERAIRLEDELKRDVLMPVALDDFVFNEWTSGRRADVLGKMIADARGWEENPSKFDEVRERLIRDLELP